MIREANALDKTSILKFCKDTFSWGDYVDQVWDFWLSEGNLFLFEKQSPIGICHAFYSKDQIWIEGIRIDPNFRRQNIATELVKHAESIGKEKNISFSYMLIDTENTSSLSMANSLDYDIFQTWNFYSLIPKRNSNHDTHFEKSVLSTFYVKNKIVKSDIDGNVSIGILTDSEHFEKTLIVTLFSGSKNTTLQVISFLQNYGMEKNYEKIQILTKEQLPLYDSLEHRISFNLMKKSFN